MPKIYITTVFHFAETIEVDATEEEIEYRETKWKWPERWSELQDKHCDKILKNAKRVGIDAEFYDCIAS